MRQSFYCSRHAWAQLGALFLLTVCAPIAHACPLCVELPRETLVDKIAQAKCVLLASLSPESQFEFSAQEVIQGRYDSESINLFVDSVTRRVLTLDSERRVILVQSRLGTWSSFGVASANYEALVRRLVTLIPSWSSTDIESDSFVARMLFFVPLFGHDERQIRELAYLELSRAPYPLVRKLGKSVTRKDYRTVLERREYVKWRALAYLLLAQSSDPSDRQFIMDRFYSMSAVGGARNLAAILAAAIEVDRDRAFIVVRERYAGGRARSKEELAAVVRALAIHDRYGDERMRRQIAELGIELPPAGQSQSLPDARDNPPAVASGKGNLRDAVKPVY